MELAISIKGLTKFFGDLRALDNFSMEVREGEFFAFLGRNGAGKTTTINILSGLTTYKDGEVKVFGKDVVGDYREARKLIGLMPQEFNFDDYFTVEEILRFYAGYFGIRRHDARKRVDELLEQFELTQKSTTHVRQLSGGMKRRLLIARALVHDPRILILDEPTAGVDVDLRRNLWRFMQELNKQGTTIFLTTHYIEEAERLAKRIGIIDQGKLIALDDKDNLIEQLHKKNLDITLTKPIDAIPKPLTKYKAFLLNDDKIRIVCEENVGKAEILADVRKAGLEVKMEEATRSSLEDIFIDLTEAGRGEP